jgi:threonine dehydrogenase-like Zn-dependent dehydrogenase
MKENTVTETMKAFVVLPGRKVGVVDKPVPQAGPDDAIVRTTAASVCISDPHAVETGFLEHAGRVGTTLGHEGIGIIHRVGEQVRGLKEGDRVAVAATTPCFRCENCLRGFTSHCSGQIGGGFKFIMQKDGTLAEYFHVNAAESNLALVPDEVSDQAAIFASETMPVGFKGAEKADIPFGGTVAIFAQGPIGLMATAASRLRGAGLIIAVESDRKRQELARFYGADAIVDFTTTDPVEEIMRITGGVGVDSSIEALGQQVTFENCIKVTRPGGTISVVGWFLEGDNPYIGIPRADWGFGIADKKINSSFAPGGAELLKRLLRLIATGRVDPSSLASHRFDFDQIEIAFDMVGSKKDGMLKPLIVF